MPQFTPGELEIMRILWEHGEMKPSEVQERYPEPIKNPAVRSYLTILLEKGHVTRRRVGKAYVYRTKTPRQRVFSSMLGDLVEAFCAGSVQELVMTLVRKENLSEEDLLELKRLSDQSNSEEGQQEASSRKKREKKKRTNKGKKR